MLEHLRHTENYFSERYLLCMIGLSAVLAYGDVSQSIFPDLLTFRIVFERRSAFFTDPFFGSDDTVLRVGVRRWRTHIVPCWNSEANTAPSLLSSTVSWRTDVELHLIYRSHKESLLLSKHYCKYTGIDKCTQVCRHKMTLKSSIGVLVHVLVWNGQNVKKVEDEPVRVGSISEIAEDICIVWCLFAQACEARMSPFCETVNKTCSKLSQTTDSSSHVWQNFSNVSECVQIEWRDCQFKFCSTWNTLSPIILSTRKISDWNVGSGWKISSRNSWSTRWMSIWNVGSSWKIPFDIWSALQVTYIIIILIH